MTSLVHTFAALGDPVRFAIAQRLMAEGAQPVGALQDVAEISAPAISRHLKVLRQAGLVTQKVDGTKRIYAINPEAMKDIDTWLRETEAFWSASLDRLADALNDELLNGEN